MRTFLIILSLLVLVESTWWRQGWWNRKRGGGEGEGECWKGHHHGPHGEGEGECGHDHSDHCSQPGPFFCGSLFRYISVSNNKISIAKKRWRGTDVLASFTLQTIVERTSGGAQVAAGAVGAPGSHSYDFTKITSTPAAALNSGARYQGLPVCQTSVVFPLGVSNGYLANVTIDMYLFQSTGRIVDGPFLHDVTAGSVKFVITVNNWNWCTGVGGSCTGTGSYLDFQLSSSTPRLCLQCPTDKTVFSGGCGIYMILPQDVFIDGRTWATEPNSYPQLAGGVIKNQLPYFQRSISWSPIYSVAQPFAFWRPSCPTKRAPTSSSARAQLFSSSAVAVIPSSSAPVAVIPSSSAAPAPVIPSSSAPAPIIPSSSAAAPIIPSSSAPAPIIPSSSAPAPIVPSSSAAPAPIIPSSSAPAAIIPSSSAPVVMTPSSSVGGGDGGFSSSAPIDGFGSSSQLVFDFSSSANPIMMSSSSSSGSDGGACDPQDDPDYNPWNSTCSRCGCFRTCPLSALPNLRFFTAALRWQEQECRQSPTTEMNSGAVCNVDCDVGFIAQGFWTCIDGGWYSSNFSAPCQPIRYAVFNITASNSTDKNCGIITEDENESSLFIRTCAGGGMNNVEVQIAIFDDVVPSLPDEFIGNPEPPFTIGIKDQDQMPSNAYLNVSLCRPDFLPVPPLRLYQSEDFGETWTSSMTVCTNLGIPIDPTPKYTPLDPDLNVACWTFPICHTTLFVMGPVTTSPEGPVAPYQPPNHNDGMMWVWVLGGIGALAGFGLVLAFIRKCRPSSTKRRIRGEPSDAITSNYVMLDDQNDTTDN